MKTKPKPQVDDLVEMIDMSNVCGNVIKIVSDKEIEIDWGDKISIEKIKNVALVTSTTISDNEEEVYININKVGKKLI